MYAARHHAEQGHGRDLRRKVLCSKRRDDAWSGVLDCGDRRSAAFLVPAYRIADRISSRHVFAADSVAKNDRSVSQGYSAQCAQFCSPFCFAQFLIEQL
jgi:hypothetical protein